MTEVLTFNGTSEDSYKYISRTIVSIPEEEVEEEAIYEELVQIIHKVY
jgi:hypothetical protein